MISTRGTISDVDERDLRRSIRGAVARHDGAEVVNLVSSGFWPPDALQLIGDGLRIALDDGVDGAPGLARDCISALGDRDWEGDAELATVLGAHLGAHLGTATNPPLPPLPVDLEELAMILGGASYEDNGRVDLFTGEVWLRPAIDYAREMEEEDEDESEDSEHWLWVRAEGSRSAYRDMEVFIADVEDEHISDLLETAITGRGAFRRFKDVLSRWPELEERWYGFSEDRQCGRARAWLAAAGYVATPRPSTPPEP
jgi:Uncharacterised protein family (UPF0158)